MSVLCPQYSFVWDQIWNSDDRYSRHQLRKRRALERIRAFELGGVLTPEPSILDVGCGTGEALRIVETMRPSAFLVGLDRSTAALQRASSCDPASQCTYVLSDAAEMPFGDETFDFVFMFGLLEHVPRHHEVLKAVAKVLRPGGYCFLTSSNNKSVLQIKARCLSAFTQYKYGFQRNWSAEELRMEIGADFNIVATFLQHADRDTPVTRFADKVLSRIIGGWSRYICFVLRAK